MASPSAAFTAANLSWVKVAVRPPYQRLTAEIQVRGGRLRETINDPEPLFHLRNVSAEPLLPGAVPLSGVPEGLFNKNLIGGIRTIEPEPPPADQVAEMIRRYVMFQAANFMGTGAAEFPKATEPSMHTELLMKGRFVPVVDASVTIFGAAGTRICAVALAEPGPVVSLPSAVSVAVCPASSRSVMRAVPL